MTNIIQRAYELAPQCASVKELRRALAGEGYSSIDAHIGGLGTQRQLRKLYNGGAGALKRGPKPRASVRSRGETLCSGDALMLPES